MEGSDYDQFKRDRGIGQPSPASSAPSGYATTAQPETSLEVDPRLTGAAPAPEKKGIADKMKDLFGGHKAQNTESSDLSGYPPNQQPVYGDATDDTGTTDTKVGFVDKIKSKVGMGHHQGSAGSGVGHHPDAHPHGTGAPPSHYGTHASTLDPTGPSAGSAFGDHSETFGQPGHLKTDTPYGTGRGYDYSRKNPSLGPGNPLFAAGNYDAAATKYGTGSNESGYATRTEQMPYSSGVGKSSGMNPESYGGVGAPGYEARTESSPDGTGAGVGKMSGMNPEGVGGNDYITGGGGAPGYEARTETAPYGRGPQSTNTQNYGVRNTGFNSGSNVNESGAVHGGWPHPTDPRTVPGGVTNDQGGAVLTDAHGNLAEGPRDDNVKKEGFMGKIMDKLHSPKSTPSSTTSTKKTEPY